MPVQKLLIPPGIEVESTALLSGGTWNEGQFIRFFQGYIQKLGGWAQVIATAVLGTARAMLSWEDATSNQYLIIGSEQALQVYFNGILYNITPIAVTDTVAVSFSTTSGSPTVKITDTGNTAVAGNLIYVLNPISVGGLIIQGSYQIASVVDANNYTITAASNATGNVTNGGAAALFTSTLSSTSIKVTLNNHGLALGGQYTVYVSTTIATITLLGLYTVATVIDANNFTIVPGGTASSGTTASENAGNVTLQYLLGVGSASSMNSSGLYGEGAYGQGVYNIGNSNTFVPARLWSFGYWGTDVNASYTNGPVYTWISESGVINNNASLIATSPQNVNAGIFTAMPQQQVVALGASVGSGSTTDQMLVRWSDVGDDTAWTATATNQAGSFRIPRGAHIVGGIQGPQVAMLWTDVGLWLMQYIGFPLVYGFLEIGQGCGLIGQNAKGVLSGKVYWMSFNNFFVYDGNSVQVLPCDVWDIVFQNINQGQAVKVIACPNSYFNEISWCFPSASGSGENDTRVTYYADSGKWSYEPTGAIVRTAWLDQSAFSAPLGIDGAGLIQQHEVAPDANGTAMVSYAQTGFMKIADGLEYTFLERIIPDAILESCTMQITLYFQNYPNGPVFTIGPLSFAQATTYLIVRGRGRLVSIRVGSSDVGSFWRLGEFLLFGSPAGRR